MPSNTDEFRVEALRWKDQGTYCKHDPKSLSGRRYWIEQAKRCIDGYHIGRDWIPGYFYWYLNFSPILKAIEDTKEETDSKYVKGKRIYDFPDFHDGDYDYYYYLDDAEKRGLHGVVLKARGKGYSFKGASMCTRNFFLIPHSKSYCITSHEQYLIRDGILTKAWSNMDFIDRHTAWAKRRQKFNTKLHKRASYEQKVDGRSIEKGYMSEVIGISIASNPDKVRGLRGKLILYEEAGSNPHLLKCWQISESSMRQDNITYGQMVAFGTGGDEEADFMGLEELFYKGHDYDVHLIQNKWDKDAGYNSRCAYFVPDYMNKSPYMDKDGNSLIEPAIKDITEDREEKKKTMTNMRAFYQYCAEHPIDPQDALFRMKGSRFPVRDLKERVAKIEVNPKVYKDSEYLGWIVASEQDNKFVWKVSGDAHPITEFPLRTRKRIEGCPVIWEQPVVDPATGKPPFGRYIAGVDPVDDDKDEYLESESLMSALILDTFTDKIVAEYTGRPDRIEDYYEQLRRLLIYYNAIANYEQQKKGLFSYFNQHNCLHLLCDIPQILREQGVSEFGGRGNRSKGTMASTPVNDYGIRLIENWLKSDALVQRDDEQETEKLKNYDHIRSVPLLNELIYWNKDGNFDRVSALIMLMILRQDRIKIKVKQREKIKRVTDDDFFDRNFKGTKSYSNEKIVQFIKESSGLST